MVRISIATTLGVALPRSDPHINEVELATKSMRNSAQDMGEINLEGVRQFYVSVEGEERKLDTLCDFCETLASTQPMIYCNTLLKAACLASKLMQRGFTVFIMHADANKKECARIMREFRSNSSHVLISTTPLPRGISAQQVLLVMNCDLPQNKENYLKRLGPLGRKCIAINFVRNQDIQVLKDIERHYHTQIEEVPVDIADVICIQDKKGGARTHL